MTDYTCPDCGAGFPEKAGKVRVEAPWKENVEGWLDHLTFALMDAIAMRTYHEVHCPNCGYVVVGDNE